MNQIDTNQIDTLKDTQSELPIGKIIYLGYTLAHLAMLLWAAKLFASIPTLSLALLILVLAGLVYDNFIIFIGDRLQLGTTLEKLNQGRYWCHGLLSPLLLIVAVQMLHFAQVSWDRTPWSDGLAWSLTCILMGVEVVTRMVKLNLKPVQFAGTLRYKEVVPSRELPVILVILLLGAIGAIVWQRLDWPWLLGGAAVMMLGSAVPTTTKAGPSIGSGVEVILAWSLVATLFVLGR
ncbi:MAG: hypothetical protein MUF72_18205 [Elainella sp. Prado103]|nr:hypothetical protein [Elainella sp. Prado103]